MAPKIDLTGIICGDLTVIREDGHMYFGGQKRAWLCRCKCGAMLRVPITRLARPGAAPNSHHLRACDDCRIKKCVICGGSISGKTSTTTCSVECRSTLRKMQGREYYYRRSHDPAFVVARAKIAHQQRAAMTPDERQAHDSKNRARKLALHGRDKINADDRASHARRMATDPDYAAKRRERGAQSRAENPEAHKSYWRNHARRKREAKNAAELNMTIGNLIERSTTNDDTNSDT